MEDIKIEQEIIICEALSSVRYIQPYLNKGWLIVSVVAENVSSSSGITGGHGLNPSYTSNIVRGCIVYVLEKRTKLRTKKPKK